MTQEVVPLPFGLCAVVLTRDDLGSPAPTLPDDDDDDAPGHRRSVRSRRWGDDPDADTLRPRRAL